MIPLSEAPTLPVIAAAWLTYFLLHSLLASLRVKNAVARHRSDWMPAYRLAFNLLAVLLILPPLWLIWRYPGATLWQWMPPWSWLLDAAALAAIGGFFWSLRYYDGSEFLGLRQLRSAEHSILDQERFRISPLHRFVRHPWYSLGLIIIWSRDMTEAWLITCVLATLYFIFGSRLEEAKLMRYHGEAYRRYRAAVPALLPLPWRYLSGEESARLLASARGSEHRSD